MFVCEGGGGVGGGAGQFVSLNKIFAMLVLVYAHRNITVIIILSFKNNDLSWRIALCIYCVMF